MVTNNLISSMQASLVDYNTQSVLNEKAPQKTNEAVSYPQFGQVIENPQALSLKQKVSKAAKIGLIGVALFGVGMAVGGISIGSAAGIGLAAVGIYLVAKKIFSTYYSHRYRLAFEPAVNNPNAPKLGEYSQVDLRVSNHATESLEWRKALISSAQQSIEYSANFAGGRVFREVLQLMEKQMTKFPELKCHILLSSDLLEQQDKDYLVEIKKAYPNFNYLITDRIYTTSPEILSEENHVKMLVVDGQYFVMGGTGMNEKMSREEAPNTTSEAEPFSAKFIDKAFRDTDIIGYGNAAQTMRNQFFNLYRIWEHRMTGKDTDHYFPTDSKKAGKCDLFHEETGLIKKSSLKYVVGGPEHRQKNPISSEIARLAERAEKDIKIANLLFNPDKIVRKALKMAKNKGLSIQGYFNGTGKSSSSGHYLYAFTNRHNYKLVTEGFEYQKKDQLYHKKIMTVDSRYTVVGSFNLGVKSAKFDYENVCVIDDSRVADLMNAALKDDAKVSKRLTADQLTNQKKANALQSFLTINLIGNLFG